MATILDSTQVRRSAHASSHSDAAVHGYLFISAVTNDHDGVASAAGDAAAVDAAAELNPRAKESKLQRLPSGKKFYSEVNRVSEVSCKKSSEIETFYFISTKMSVESDVHINLREAQPDSAEKLDICP